MSNTHLTQRQIDALNPRKKTSISATRNSRVSASACVALESNAISCKASMTQLGTFPLRIGLIWPDFDPVLLFCVVLSMGYNSDLFVGPCYLALSNTNHCQVTR